MGEMSFQLNPELIDYSWDRVKFLFHSDSVTLADKQRLEAHFRMAALEASSIQCVGMPRPLPLDRLYINTHLTIGREPTQLDTLIVSRQSAVISGNAGQGKTTFMHWAYLQYIRNDNFVPMLFTLRKPDSIESMECIVELLENGRAARAIKLIRDKRILLFVDGYDEVPLKERKHISELLLRFSAMDIGNFYLACRSFYEILELKIPICSIAPFMKSDAIEYVNRLADFHNSKLIGIDVVNELDANGFTSFWQHPLLLTLVCILKTGPLPSIPKTKIGLIRKAIDVLSFNWDYAKGIDRESQCDLDSEDREQCLMHIAFEMKLPLSAEGEIVEVARGFLKLIRRPDIQARKLLLELAQFYGLLIPADDITWQFTHRTVHDYLAAKFWVDNGKFVPRKVVEWNTRAAYAACLQYDATESIELAMLASPELHVLVECLSNAKRFDSSRVAQACTLHFRKFPDKSRFSSTDSAIHVSDIPEWISYADDELIHQILLEGLGTREPARDYLVALSLGQCTARKLELRAPILNQLRLRFPRKTFEFVFGSDQKLSRIRPHELR